MFESILNHIEGEVPLDVADSIAPMTFDLGGRLLTVGDVVDLYQHHGEGVERLDVTDFGVANLVAEQAGIDYERLPRAVEDLDMGELRVLAMTAVDLIPEGLAIGSMAGEIEPGALRDEIEAGTTRGDDFVRAVRNEAIFMQEAARAGKLGRTEPEPPEAVELET